MKSVIEEVKSTIKHWWISLVIGIIAIILGIWSMFTPLTALSAITIVFIIAFFISGISEIVFAVYNRKLMAGWGWTLTGGIIDVMLGIMLAALPTAMATVVLIYFVGFWIMLRSIWGIGASADLQRMGVKGWGWMLVLAILSLIFSIIFIFSSPLFGGTFVVVFVSIALLVYGIFRIYMAIQLKSIKNKVEKIKEKVTDFRKDLTE